MKRFVVGVDPDLDNTGIAIWDRENKDWSSIFKVAIEDLADAFKLMDRDDVIFYVESGWMIQKANFRRGHKFSVSEEMAMRVGQNHACSKIASRILKKMGFEVVTIAPLAKGFLKNKNGWTPQGRKHIYEVLNIKKKISDDEKDSALIAYTFR